MPKASVLAAWSVGLLFVAAPSFADEAGKGLFITQVALHRSAPNRVFALTTYSIGLLRSLDRGETWSLANHGIRSFSLYRLTIDPRDSNRIYVGAGGGGLYVSEDAGDTFEERNDGLGNTDIGFLALHPTRPDQVYVVTSTGVYRSPDQGRTWAAWNQGDRFTESQQCQDLVVATSTTPETVLLASNRGVFTRREGDATWALASDDLVGRRITALTMHPDGRRVLAAAFRDSRTLTGGGLYESRDAGSSWRRVDRGLDQDWVRVIRFDPEQPRWMYVGTSTRGVLKSTDNGATWSPINDGLGASDVRSMAIDPANRRRLYAGTHGAGVFVSADGGAHWRALDRVPATSPDEIITALKRQDPSVAVVELTPPPAFSKCNACHGWTDPALNQTAHSLWLMPPNRRDWVATVRRMSRSAGLTDSEMHEVAEFLTRYAEARVARRGAARGAESKPLH
jgi:photosystem II stability/assembly factor-like uncharacterized protein